MGMANIYYAADSINRAIKNLQLALMTTLCSPMNPRLPEFSTRLPYLHSLINCSVEFYQTRSQDWLFLQVPAVHIELGKTAFSYCAPYIWNQLQQSLKLNTLVPIGHFRNYNAINFFIKKPDAFNCQCFSVNINLKQLDIQLLLIIGSDKTLFQKKRALTLNVSLMVVVQFSQNKIQPLIEVNAISQWGNFNSPNVFFITLFYLSLLGVQIKVEGAVCTWLPCDLWGELS